MKKTLLCSSLAILGLFIGASVWAIDENGYEKASTAITLDEAVVSAKRESATNTDKGYIPLGSYKHKVTPDDQARTSSTADTLYEVPAVSLQQNGGVSTIPFIHGQGDDRVKVVINGMSVTSACSNHMNPPLSYIDPTNVNVMQVIAGITPVSMGGDSTGGTIIVDSKPPVFAEPGQKLLTEGNMSSYYRSNNKAYGGSVSTTVATGNVSAGYTGSWDRAGDYHDGNGNTVTSTYYRTNSQTATIAARNQGNLLVIQGGQQSIPYQGFVNQQMDMTRNFSEFLNLRYKHDFNWGWLEARLYWRDVRHEMNVGKDKIDFPNPMFMPMETHGRDMGYSLRVERVLSEKHTVRAGNEFHRFLLDDWWPPVAGGAPLMGPNTFQSVNSGRRDRFGTFGEWEAKWAPAWTTLFGVRNDTVWMNAGVVEGYSNAYAADSRLFSARSRGRTDVNYDVTALVRYEPDKTSTYEGGYARKTRSPNLYERYAWSTNRMASGMINWFGDGNMYVGNLDLDPEVAHTLSVTANWHDASRKDWELKATPYFTYIEDYIGVDRLTTVMYGDSAFSQLRFSNHDAKLYGFDISGYAAILDNSAVGRILLKGIASFVRGETVANGNSLYHMMPLNGIITVEQTLNKWKNGIELQLVNRKTAVDPLRFEPKTAGYALVNLRSSYQWEKVRLDAGITNLLDKMYSLPLGGVNFDDFLASGWSGKIGPLQGPGRSFYAAITVKF